MKISVVLCTYNGERFIQEQLISIINQTRKIDELIICDDGSIDNTVGICKEYLKQADIEYSIIVNKKNIGITKNFSKALSKATGDIIFTCDQDDYWKNSKIEEMVLYFDDPDCLLVFSNAELVDEKRNRLSKKTLWDMIGFCPKQVEENNIYLNILLQHSIVTGATMAVKKTLLDVIKVYPDCWVHDGWIAINAAVRGKIVAINKCLIEYRQHDANAIGAKCESRRGNITYNKKRSLERYKIFYLENKDFLSQSDEKIVKSCLNFWEEMNLLKESSVGCFVKIIIKNMVNKNIFAYSNGFKCIEIEIKNKILGR